MPAPVSFTLSLAPLDVNFSGSLQDFATAVVDRLTITPSEPWSSFQNGGAIPDSDVGPVLFQGMEWRVFDSDAGEYTYHRQHGDGLIDGTVDLVKIVDGTAGSLFLYDGDGKASSLAVGAAGTVLTSTGTLPAWTARPTAKFFEVTRTSSDQALETDGAGQQIVQFNLVNRSSGVTYDTTNYRVPVLAGETWFFYCALQMEDIATASSDVQVVLEIRPNGLAGVGIGQVRNYMTAQNRDGMHTSGVLTFDEDGYVDVAVNVLQNTPESSSLEISANASNTRFGGYQIL